MIKFEEVYKSYGEVKAVNGVTLSIDKGTFFCLLGPNGAGKTTLIRMLTSLVGIEKGSIHINEIPVSRDAIEMKKSIGVVSQHINLDKELTIEENLIFTGKLYKMDKKKIRERTEELLELLELKDARNRLCKKLSGGMSRKLMIGKGIFHDPDVVILDEPTVGIDTKARRMIWNFLKRINSEGKTILMTTHYIEEAEYLCEKVALMDKGEIFNLDSPQNLIIELGDVTVEYMEKDFTSAYEYCRDMEQAKKFASKLSDTYTIRKTTLDDVFYNFTNRMVE